MSSNSWIGRSGHFMSTLLFSVSLLVPEAVYAGRPPISVITRDIAVLGGGASGTYAAVRLREDYNKSIVVIEPQSVLGGHVNTFTNPDTGAPINYGVQSYIDYGPAKAFFARFDIPTQPNVIFSATTHYIDATTGKNASYYTTPTFPEELAALQTYLSLIEPYNNILLPGYWDFPPGHEIPSDLLLLWPDFVAKYGIQDMVPILKLVAQVEGRPDEPTLYVLMNFGQPVTAGFLNGTLFDPVPFNNSILYGKAQDLLAEDLLLSSRVTLANRSEDGVSLLVESSETGALTLVKAKRLLVSAQPSLTNLETLGLDEHEKSIFSTWAPSGSFAVVVKTNILPPNITVQFVPPSANASALPYNFAIDWLGVPTYHRVLFNSQVVPPYTPAEAKATILSGFKAIAEGGAFPAPSEPAYYDIVAFADHTSVRYNQSVEMLEGGFVQKLYGLQGYRGTWYTGGLWCPDYSSNTWAFTDTVLPRLLQDM